MTPMNHPVRFYSIVGALGFLLIGLVSDALATHNGPAPGLSGSPRSDLFESGDGVDIENSPFEGGQRRVAKAERRRGMFTRPEKRFPASRANIPRPSFVGAPPSKGDLLGECRYPNNSSKGIRSMSTVDADRHTAIANWQLIHNVPDAGLLDVYRDGERLLDDFDFRDATPFEIILAGTYRFDFVAGADTSNSNPIFTTDLTFNSDLAYVIVLHGLAQPEAGEPAFQLAVIADALLASSSADNVEVALVHSGPDIGPIDVRLLDPVDNNNAFDLLANNIDFADVVLYKTLMPTGYNVEISSTDNSIQHEVFRLALQAFRGEALVLTISGRGTSNAEGLEAMHVAADGTVTLTPLITANDAPGVVPAAFALHGNHPNPFHPSTAIRIDLPAPAAVRVDLYDLHGRRVLTTPAHSLAAGTGRLVPVDAAPLASGVYLYRVFAQTSVETYAGAGRMVLVR